MYPIPPSEHLVENKTCKQCSATFPITDKDMEFYTKLSPTFAGKKYQIPPPTLCPDCRQQRRLAFRNERKLYKRKCDATGKEIVSCFSPVSEIIVYDLDYWWSDIWDATLYSMDYSSNIPFFDQIEILYKKIPKRALMQGTHNVNSPFSNCIWECKNTYMIFASTNATDCYHSERISYSHDCIDCSSNPKSSQCYEILDGVNNSRCFFSKEIQWCSDCIYCFHCTGCHDCFGCTNLTNASYQIFNKGYSPENYKKVLGDIQKQKDIKDPVNDFWWTAIRKTANILGSMNTTGDMITNSSNIHTSFSVKDGCDIRYSVYAYGGSHDIMDTYACVKNSSNIYESAVINKESTSILFSYDCWSHCNKLLYCLDCRSCNNCFGCTWLVSKSYCILNKQYTKEEYESLVPQIIEKMMNDGEWGEFFPASLSPFGYNETVAEEYFSLTREEVLGVGKFGDTPLKGGDAEWSEAEGVDLESSKTNPPVSPLTGGRDRRERSSLLHWPIFNWLDYEAPFPKVEKIIPASKLPDEITSIPDDILNWAIECEVSRKPYRIIKQELEFYRKHHLPIPRRHPDVRHMDRMKMRNPRKLFERQCDKCSKDMITTYSPERPERVYCEECYETEVSR